jgi:MoaA/NifB/PqqE/SkfB family radical SAM enzyme
MARQLSWKRAYLKGLACVEEDGFIVQDAASAHEVCHRGVNMSLVRLRRILRRANRRVREARMLARSLRFRYQPVAAHLIPIRRCNLSCTYCNEYDDRSAPVPTADVLRRIDRLADLGTGVVTLSGGEPLLHPDLDAIINHIRRRGAIATLITNGYLLTRDRIERLNRAGLDHLQISIDNVMPDEVSKKSLKVLDQKLSGLANAAEFDVTVNAVVGSGVRNPADALTIATRARELGFSTTAGIIHDGSGRLVALDEEQRTVLEQVVSLGKSWFDFANYNRFQKNLAEGQPNDWQCHAGARYLYVCEDGLVHWCSQQRGHPGIPLAQYSFDHLRTEYHRVKSCAPMCTVGCVHRVAQVDELREDPQGTLAQWFAAPVRGQPPRLPLPVKILKWAFVTSPGRGLFRKAAAGMSGGPRRS